MTPQSAPFPPLPPPPPPPQSHSPNITLTSESNLDTDFYYEVKCDEWAQNLYVWAQEIYRWSESVSEWAFRVVKEGEFSVCASMEKLNHDNNKASMFAFSEIPLSLLPPAANQTFFMGDETLHESTF